VSLISGCSNFPVKSQLSIINKDPKVEKIQMQSNALNKKMNVDIYLPRGYSKERLYPVLYLLHGQDGNENSWIKDMKVDEKATKLIDANQIAPLIIVMPNYGNSYGTNKYGDFITKDLVYYIDSNYSTINI
jgi:enterochelin esterase-like enzyme